MKLIWLTAACVLLLMPLCAAQDVTVCLPNSDHPSAVALDPFTGMHFEEIYGKPKVSSPPANSVAHDPRYPGVYDTWSGMDSNYRCRFLNWQTTAFRRRLQHSDESRSVESDVFENRETGRTVVAGRPQGDRSPFQVSRGKGACAPS